MKAFQMLSRYFPFICVMFFLALSPTLARSQNDQKEKDKSEAVKIQFNPKTQSFVVDGVVTGMEVIDYTFTAEKGQRLTLSLKHGQGHSIAEVIVFSVNGEPPQQRGTWQQTVLEQSGEYLIRVLLPRAYGRRHTKHTFTLTVKLEGKSDPSTTPDARH